MAQLTITTIDRGGQVLDALAVAASAGGDYWLNDGAELLYIKNAGASPITVTLNFGSNVVIDGQAPASRTMTVANGTSRLCGPFPVNLYNDASGRMQLSYSAVASVTVLALKPTTT